MISLIVAKAGQGAIGFENRLLWHLSEDLKYFKRITLGKTVLMGRKTWESLPFKPLKNRRNVVISAQKDYAASGAEVCESLEKALEILANEDIFCIGGASVYKAILPKTDRLFITEVFKSYHADAYFPPLNPQEWKLTRQSPMLFDSKEGVNFRFEVWERAQSAHEDKAFNP